MIEHEIFEKNNESLTDFIGNDFYTFDIVTLTTKYFSDKDEILLKIIKNIKVNGNKPNKLNIEKLVAKIRDDRFITGSGNKYKKYNNLQTVKQHYVKNSIQQNWNNSDCVLFKINGLTIKDNKAFDENLENTMLVDYDDINHDDKKHFEPKSTYVKDFTFDFYGEDYFLYLEDGIVTILEKLFERTIENNIESKILELSDDKIKNVMSYFFTPYLKNRITEYQDFALFIFKNYKNTNAITAFMSNKKSLLKLFIINNDFDCFNLTSDWIEYLYYTDLYDECAYNWSESLIMPYSPKTALLFFDTTSLKYFKKYPFDKEDFLINTILSIVDKRMNASDTTLIANDYYQANTLIRLATSGNKLYINSNFNNKIIYNLLKQGNFKKISHIIVKYWRNKNIKNTKENKEISDKILIEQSNHLKNTLEARGSSIEEARQQINDMIKTMGSRKKT